MTQGSANTGEYTGLEYTASSELWEADGFPQLPNPAISILAANSNVGIFFVIFMIQSLFGFYSAAETSTISN